MSASIDPRGIVRDNGVRGESARADWLRLEGSNLDELTGDAACDCAKRFGKRCGCGGTGKLADAIRSVPTSTAAGDAADALRGAGHALALLTARVEADIVAGLTVPDRIVDLVRALREHGAVVCLAADLADDAARAAAAFDHTYPAE